MITTTGTIQILLAGLSFPEGPAFAPDGSLWTVELQGESLLQLHEGQLTRHLVGGAPNGLAIDAQGRIWFCDSLQMAIRRFDPITREVSVQATAVDDGPLHKPNDLAFDPRGNLVFTCPGESRQEPTGYGCVLRPDGTVRKFTSGKFYPNGLAFTADGRQLVVAETYRQRLWLGDWDPETAQWCNARVWAEMGGPIGPDGLAFAANGDLYVAVYGSGRVKIITPTGHVRAELSLPGPNPTNCAFDPTGQLGLVVTEASFGLLLSIPVATQGSTLFAGSSPL